jgi:DNA replication protein DnaC
MVQAFSEQLTMADLPPLSCEERLGLLVDRERTDRDNRRLQTRLRQAKLRVHATLEDLDSQAPRGLEKTLMLTLAACQWVKEHRNILITGPTGIGKTWVACALGQKACREG